MLHLAIIAGSITVQAVGLIVLTVCILRSGHHSAHYSPSSR